MARSVGDIAVDSIFISYRRDDSRHVAGRIHDRLVDRFADATIFMDVDSIEPGVDFAAAIEDAVGSCDVLLAIIGAGWLTSVDDRGRQRLGDPNDFVALEIGSAIDRGVRVLPILVDGAELPHSGELPDQLAPLARRHAMRLDHETFRTDVEAVLEAVARTLHHGSAQEAVDPLESGGARAPMKAWNVPARNPHFTGREEMLAHLRDRLGADERTLVVQALYGLGGVGKTQLVLEYAHRLADEYDIVWWIDGEQRVLIPEQLAALAPRLALPLGPTVPDTVDRVLATLRGRGRWLLIFDNAERPSDLVDFQPGGGRGHVLITSRYPAWGALGGRLEVDVLTRSETVRLLTSRVPSMKNTVADNLAAELGDLPLAAAQAAAYLEQTDMPPADYLRRFRTRRAALLARGDVVGYRGRIDTAWALSLERLRIHEPAAVQLLDIAACLAPEPIPLFVFGGHPELLPDPLGATAADPDFLDDTVGSLVGYSLVRRHQHGFQVHRLVQAVIRNQLSTSQQHATTGLAVELLSAASPGDPEDPSSWDRYQQLAPHVLVNANESDASKAGRRLLVEVAQYLHGHGDSAGSRAVAEPMLDRWRLRLGPDDVDTLTAAGTLTVALNELGEGESARRLGEDSLQRCRRVVGPDHPITLWTAAALTAALVGLGAYGLVRTLGEDTLRRSRDCLGPDHSTTLWAAVNVTVARALLGDAQPAATLGQDTLSRCRRILGPDHPTTLWGAAVQTIALLGTGAAESARCLGDDTMRRSSLVLGPDHTTTLAAAAALIQALYQLGDSDHARSLGEDTLERSSRVYGSDNPLTLYVIRAVNGGPPAGGGTQRGAPPVQGRMR